MADITSPTIENIYSNYYATYQNGIDFTISFYEKNSLYFKNIKQLNDKEDLRKYVELVGRYVDALYQKGYYAKVVDVVNDSNIYINKEIGRLRLAHSDLKNTWYYNLGLIKGMACYALRQYKTAISVFKNLIQVDSENDKYKNWLHSSRYAQWSRFVRIIGISCMILIGITFIFDHYISYHIGMPIIKIVFPILILVSFYEYFPHLFFRNKKK
jgi:hypothetical protein